jgi:hypothetical protein
VKAKGGAPDLEHREPSDGRNIRRLFMDLGAERRRLPRGVVDVGQAIYDIQTGRPPVDLPPSGDAISPAMDGP